MSMAFIFLVVFSSILVELTFGSFGLTAPFTAMAVFYVSAVYEWKTGLAVSLISGTALDALYGRTLLITPFLLMLVIVISLFWLYKGETKSLIIHFIPGGLCGALVSIPLLLVLGMGPEGGFSGLGKFSHLATQSMFSIVVSALWMPVFLLVVDSLSGWLGLEIYATVKERLAERG